jgi:hypothetical protein
MTPLEEGVRDYVQNYLKMAEPHFDATAVRAETTNREQSLD